MNRFCTNCGNTLADNSTFCTNCGSPANNSVMPTAQQQVTQPQQTIQQQTMSQQPMMQQQSFQQNYNNQFNGNGNPNMGYSSTPGIQRKEIVTAILLSLVTCGIYGIIWFISLTNDANTASGEPNQTTGGMAFLFTILTCGIYSFYWCYQMGKKMEKAGRRYGKPISDNSILYLVLAIFGLGIVNYCLIQTDLNNLSS